VQVCALNGYNCVDTEYAWYQQQQQQQQKQVHLSSYRSLLLSTDDRDKSSFMCSGQGTVDDYCPSCVALYAAQVDAISTAPEAGGR